MCGIVGYAGHRPAIPVVVEELHRLEYRGYDSAGVACVQQGAFRVVRAQGKLSALEQLLSEQAPSTATTGMGHTRWATHGAPAVRNAHPHLSNDASLALVHNGIIENYLEIKKDLAARGYVFHSETDTEVLVNLIQECHRTEPDLRKAFARALSMAHGAYAVCLMSKDEPDAFYAARMSAPLILGVGTGENFVASDIPAFLPYTRKVVFLEDGEMVRVTSSSFAISRVLAGYAQSGSLTGAEQQFTEERLALLKDGDDSCFSIGPVVSYLMQRETEARGLRVLFAQKL